MILPVFFCLSVVNAVGRSPHFDPQSQNLGKDWFSEPLGSERLNRQNLGEIQVSLIQHRGAIVDAAN